MGEPHDRSAPKLVIVLIGLMGSGKSSVGRRLANSLNMKFYDTDELVASEAGKTVRDLFAEGEAVFRAHERRALVDALGKASRGSGVIATGGGVVTVDENCADIRKVASMVVWLDADLDELVARTANGSHRPLLDGGARGTLEEMQRTRMTSYESLATVRIATKGRSIASITDQITSAVGEERP